MPAAGQTPASEQSKPAEKRRESELCEALLVISDLADLVPELWTGFVRGWRPQPEYLEARLRDIEQELTNAWSLSGLSQRQ
jgi:hypothetical protein